MESIRVLDSPSRCMQRLGYLKYLAARCGITETSSLETLGRDLIDTVTRKVYFPLDENIVEYIQHRPTDASYRDIKKQLAKEPPDMLYVELQDIYLASPLLPSRTGKLISADWRKYPSLGTSLGLIRKGTYSSLVRGQALVKLCQADELEAFRKPIPEANPLLLRLDQKIFFLFCLVESDGDVLQRLYSNLLDSNAESFTDRDAGNLLPVIYREIERQSRNRIVSMDDRERLRKLVQTADSIAKWKGRADYKGKDARGENIVVRLEPLVDIGLLAKGDSFKYEYAISDVGRKFFRQLGAKTNISEFLSASFFKTCTEAFDIKALPIHSHDLVIEALYQACEEIKSPLGYAPIEDVAIITGIRSLVNNRAYFEIFEAVQILKEFQKRHPHAVRFNIDRMGNLTYVKFLTSPPNLTQGEAGGSGHGTS